MEDLLIELLETYGYPVIRQGSLGTNHYPANFFTFWENDSSDGNHYDNDNISTIYDYDVNFYSDNPEMTYSVLREAKKMLKSAGFIISGDGYDIASDEPTHTGRGMNAIFLNHEKE